MDIGFFKVSCVRLQAWLIIPPLLMVTVGLGSYAWQQRAQWQLQETQALSDVLPPFIAARKAASDLFEGLKTDSGGELGSEDQLISFLQDIAQQYEFTVEAVNVVDQKQQSSSVLNVAVRGEGNFTAVQLYINEAKSKQRLLSVDSIRIMQPSEQSEGGSYDVEIVFDLLLMDEIKALGGGGQ